MEVFHLIGLTVIVTIAAMIHSHPNRVVHLVEHSTVTIIVRHYYVLNEVCFFS